ncbi:acetylornithine deacetylase/succinyl-diaminopimelate desuccinylase-like protein [Planomicrobium soli]|uniref:Acetylornithine deacetylase/succinyl-diaminopimelate desuccinylase-like protein n=1 Tax=Planomicrobium soli TaxID=1176648 RepID=A0A2P8GGA4_9BACL|nr:M20/M25/M40 family metallo-hydrolase [Planomicrobium soli]PSL33012.1 acetylornithine deacetylase/succinyl-diaminopimelate desuccinylase-like protein [Planomicrobium soli]
MADGLSGKEIKAVYETLVKDPSVKKALDFIHRDHENTIADQIAITEIPAPPFKEQQRAEDFQRRLEELGLEKVEMDAEGNVYGVRPGSGKGPKLFVSAHLDTVFPEGTDTSVRKEDGILYAPGIGDDTRGLAELLAVVRALNEAGIETVGDLVFGGTVGEEGAGDLRGVKAFFAEHRDIDGFLSLDGPGFNHITYLGTGSFRYTITYKGPGGHSFGDFGTPSATHALGRAIAAIADLETPEQPKTTFSVGEVKGGTSVNAIAQEASMAVDLRSNDAAALEELDNKFLAIVEKAAEAENAKWKDNRITVDIKRFGNRSPGSQSADAPIVQVTCAAVEAIGGIPKLETPSSTDANHPMSLGIPAITIGLGGTFGGAHTLEEWHNPKDGHLGIQKSLMTILGLAGVQNTSPALLAK